MCYADLLVQDSDGSSVLEFLEVILGLDVATLGLGLELNSTLVGGRGQVQLQDSGAQVGRQLHERERSARLNDDCLKTVAEHVRSDKLERLRSDQFESLTEAGFLGQNLHLVSRDG